MQTNVNRAECDLQAQIIVNTTGGADLCHLSYDIENFAAEGAILIDTIFATLDGMADIPEHLQKGFAAVSCFASCAKRHLVLIGEASGEIVEITQTVTQ